MVIIGCLLIIIGGVLIFVQKNQKTKAFSIKSARPATTAELNIIAREIAQEIGDGNWRDYIKVWGVIHTDQPLFSELKQAPCVYYTTAVRREYEETVTEKDAKGNPVQKTRRGSETISSNQQSIPFRLQDATGQITVNPDGAAIETVSILNQFQPGEASGGMLSFGQFSLALSNPQVHNRRRTLGYRYTESVLPVDRNVLVIGTVSDSTGALVVSKPLERDKKFIISLKTDQELTLAAERSARNAFYGMVACFGVGGVLVLVGLIR